MILCFHDIARNPKNEWVVSPEYFEQILEQVIRLLDLTKEPLEIHFDDAREGVYKYAFELLKPYIKAGKVHAVIFVVANWVEGYATPNEAYSDFMTWEQLNEMHAAGFEIGSHTMNHRNLLFEADLNYQLVTSKRIIEDKIGCIITKLSYPYGACDPRVIDEATRYYKYAFQLNHLPETSNWTLRRKIVLGYK